MGPQHEFEQILHLIANARNKAMQAANSEQILLYWEIGRLRLSKAGKLGLG